MKRFLLFSIMFLVCGALKAQISVTEFKSLPNDLSARTTADEKPVVDMNGDRCALVKIKTKGIAKEQRDELKFTAGTMATYIAKTEYQDSDIRLWVNPRKGTIVIYHDLFGELRYSFPEELQSQSTYSMLLELNMAGGYLYVKTNPEVGAEVFVDGTLCGKTPYLSDKINIGEHRIQVVKSDFVLLTKIVDITENNTINVEAESDFGEVIISVNDKDASIYFDNEFKANGYWKGMVIPGEYKIEARKEGCKTESLFVTIITGKNSPIKIATPQKLLGGLKISSNPVGVTVRINGEPHGITPIKIDNLYVGEYEMTLSMDGYNTITKTVFVTENKITSVEETLHKKCEIYVSADVSGAEVLIDDNKVGETPLKIETEKGKHFIKVKHKNGITKGKVISLDYDGDYEFVDILFNGMFRLRPEVTLGKPSVKTIWGLDGYFEEYINNNVSNLKYNFAVSLDYVMSIENMCFYFGLGWCFLKTDYNYVCDISYTYTTYNTLADVTMSNVEYKSFMVNDQYLDLGMSLINDGWISPYFNFKIGINIFSNDNIQNSFLMSGIVGVIVRNLNIGISYIRHAYWTNVVRLAAGTTYTKRTDDARICNSGIMLSLGYNINMGGGKAYRK